jgi:hypothetical protein
MMKKFSIEQYQRTLKMVMRNNKANSFKDLKTTFNLMVKGLRFKIYMPNGLQKISISEMWLLT